MCMCVRVCVLPPSPPQLYVSAWKWQFSRDADNRVLVPPILMPAFDIVEVTSGDLKRVRTVPAKFVQAMHDFVKPCFVMGFSDVKAHEVIAKFEVRAKPPRRA